jgi:ribonuclease P protein component
VPAAPRPRPRDLRLTRGAEIRELLKTGRRLSAPPLRVVYRPTDRGHARLAVQVSRRTARTAVRRNRIRRRTREAFRRLLSDSGMGVDVMVLAGAEVERLPWDELLARGRGVLKKIEQAERIERGEREPSPPHPA